MHTINIIFSRHSEYGQCNSDELFTIITTIKPEVIFEELSLANFNKSYHEGSLKTLETTAVKQYLEEHPVIQIPVDTLPLPPSYDDDVNWMYDRITGDKTISKTRILHSILEQQMAYTRQYGFRFLNSQHNDEFFLKIKILKQEIIELLNNDRLRQIYKLEQEILNKREDEMLTNIYRFSKENQYSRGLFFIGSGHRESILKKIQTYRKFEELMITWLH